MKDRSTGLVFICYIVLYEIRQRLFSYQNNQADPFPNTPEPDQSRLESGSWVSKEVRLEWNDRPQGGSAIFPLLVVLFHWLDVLTFPWPPNTTFSCLL